MPMSPLLRAVAVLALFGGAHAAQAAECSIIATPMVFGSYHPTQRAPTDITATITVSCTATQAEDLAYEIVLLDSERDVLEGTGGGPALRFGLFVDSSRLRRWGDGVGGTASLAGSMSLAPGERRSISHTVYGRLPVGQRAHAGTYLLAPMILLRLL